MSKEQAIQEERGRIAERIERIRVDKNTLEAFETAFDVLVTMGLEDKKNRELLKESTEYLVRNRIIDKVLKKVRNE